MNKAILSICIAVLLVAIVFSGCFEDKGEKQSEKKYDIYVDDDGTADYVSIQEAIDAASDGDAIFVYNGIYNEKLTIMKTVELVGENKNTTFINKSVPAEEGGTLIDIYAPDVVIDGFTISNPSSFIYANAIDLGGYNTLEGELLNANHTTINNCKFVDSEVGIGLALVSHNVISDCVFYNNSDEGICLNVWSSYNLIKNCTFFNCGDGIEFQNSTFNTIVDCKMFNNTHCGIVMTTMIYPYSFNNIISNCEIYNNKVDGIYMYNGFNNQIFECYIHNNSQGISLNGDSYNNTISNCKIQDNEFFAIILGQNSPEDNLHGNKIYRNSFIRNDEQWNRQVRDEGNNSWDDGSVGNYWSDYEEKYPNAAGSNDIWDTSYNITGGNNQDRYPFMNPVDI